MDISNIHLYPIMLSGDFHTPPDLLKLITEIDEFKGSWRILNSLTPDRLSSLRHVATIESIGSSTRIEGAKLSDREVEELLQGLQARSFATRDEQEVAGYAEAMDIVFANYGDIPFTENYIQQFHRDLLRHSVKDERHRGGYKKFPNHVEAFDSDGKSVGVIFETTSPFDTPFKMQALVTWTRETLADRSLHPLLVIGAFTVSFLAIHPFQDGNGRLSRILTSLLLLQAGYGYVPYSSMESVIERNKEAYYLSLRRTQTTLEDNEPDWIPWFRFFLQSLKRQKDHLASKLDEQISGSKGSTVTPELSKIMDYAYRNNRVTTGEAVKLTGAPRPTVKLWLSKLVQENQLIPHGKGRGAWYAPAK